MSKHRRSVQNAMRRGDWRTAFSLLPSEGRTKALPRLWRSVPDDEKPALLAEGVMGGDAPLRVRNFLYAALAELRAAGTLVFDDEAARAAYQLLPETVTVYRGTNAEETENRLYGICWTFDRERASWFATEHGRFRAMHSRPVVLEVVVEKADVRGLLFSRDEAEVLALPQASWHVRAHAPRP